MSDGQRLTMHGRDHRTGGHDPVPFPPGLLGGVTTTSVEDAIRNPGDLTLWYRMGDTFTFATSVSNALYDSSNYDGSSPRYLYYYENSSTGGWTTANRPTLNVAHTELGLGDDTAVQFNYDQTGFGGNFPGAYFDRHGLWDSGLYGVDGLATFEDLTGAGHQPGSGRLKTVGMFFNPSATAVNPAGVLATNLEGAIGVGSGGWTLSYDGTNVSFSVGTTGVGSFTMTSASTITRGQWYHVAVTRDDTSSPAAWVLYLDGGVAALTTSTLTDTGYFNQLLGLRLGNAGHGVNDNFFTGSIDEVTCYKKTLDEGEVNTIATAVGVVSTTGVDTVTVGAGGSSDPYAVKSGSANLYDGLEADGTGGTLWDRVHIRSYHNGT